MVNIFEAGPATGRDINRARIKQIGAKIRNNMELMALCLATNRSEDAAKYGQKVLDIAYDLEEGKEVIL
tara:strand:- start:222 stop:428 length:207 start_codon:yes stop_codon:yes gene_type:complete